MARAPIKKRPVVAIVGFGDTGVLVAVNLPRTYDLVAISTKTSLVSGQELGARLTDPERWKKDYLTPFGRFERLRGATIVNGKAVSIDTQRQTIEIAGADGRERRQAYDILVIATGITNGFWRDDQCADQDETEAALENNQATLAAADTIAIVGGGPSGVSVAANLAAAYPDKAVHFFYSPMLPLPGYHPDTRRAVAEKLDSLGVSLHPGRRAALPDSERLREIGAGRIAWSDGEQPFDADAIVWTTGATRPNTAFLPLDMLNAEGFVQVDEFLRIRGHDNAFAVGDVAATDPNRSSARNWAAPLLARNIKALLQGRPQAMKPFKPPQYRWGSILGLEHDGLRIFQPDGTMTRFPRWSVDTLLFPIIVKRMIYRGVRRA
jgi:NADH dehydrogenase FAD-containing subunit